MINKNKKRASTEELTKRISGTSKEEVSRILEILLRQNVIEIRQQGTVKESIKILNYEPGKKGSYNNSQLGLQAIDGRLKKLEDSVNIWLKTESSYIESMKTENAFLRREITELTGLLESFTNIIKRQNQSSVNEKKSPEIYEQIDVSVPQENKENKENNYCFSGSDDDNLIDSNEENDGRQNYKTDNLQEQLETARKKYHDDFWSKNGEIKKPDIYKEPLSWEDDTILITGNSIINNIDEKGISTKIANVPVKVRPFSGATIDDMYNYIQPLLQKKPKTIILHIGTNDAPNKTSQDIVNSLLDMRSFIVKKLPECKVVLSTPVKRTDNGKAMYTLIKVNKVLHELKIDMVDNDNVTDKHLSRKGLHLNMKGAGRLANNFINKIRSNINVNVDI